MNKPQDHMALQKAVQDAWVNAHVNGYRFDDWSAREIAEDMQVHVGELEDFPIELIEEEVSYLTPP